jgi:hypothetical protein
MLALLQAICLVPLLLRLVFLPPDFSAVGLWLVAAAIALPSIPYALWQGIRHPERRGLSAVMLVLSLLTIGLPLILSELGLLPLSLTGGPFPVMAVLVIGLFLGLLWLFARRSLWAQDRFWLGMGFNSALLVLLLVFLVLAAAPFILASVMGFAPPLGSQRQGLSVDAVLFHAIGIGIPGLLLVLFALPFSLAGLWRNRARAMIHAGQLAAVLVLLILLVVEAGLLSILMVNPG